ncbi:MAG: long-chain fatty acid--CoA ligase [Dehalococcoidia bacterium]
MAPYPLARTDMREVTLAAWLHRRRHINPDSPAVTFGGEVLSYAALDDRVETVARALGARGVGRGDRIAYMGSNHPMFIIALFASARLGAIFVPLNFRLTSHEAGYILKDVGARAIFCDFARMPVINQIRGDVDCEHYLAVGPNAPGWETLADGHPSKASGELTFEAAATDVAVIMYTSGTTGRPKGAQLTHLNLWANNINWALSIATSYADTGLNCAPLFHVGGLCVVVLPVLFAGGHVVLQEAFDPSTFLAALEKHRVTLTFAVPAMMQSLAQLQQFTAADLTSLRLFIAGGASVPEPLLRLYDNRRVPISQGWGMTESATAVTFLAPKDAAAKLGSCGKAVMLSEFRLVDADEMTITSPHLPGEIRLRGMNVSPGYWNRPDATVDAFDSDGWFRSGDVGYVDDDGFLYVCDRLKDMIISGGENIYSAEVESALYRHPAVAEVAVVGAPDEQWGERVIAFAVVRPGELLTLDGLRRFAEDYLARYKLPKELRLLGALPRNSSGKVLKDELRRIARQ